MTETSAGSQKRRKPGVNEPPDKSYYILSKSLDIYGKCNKNAHPMGKQYNVTCVVYGSMLSVRALHGISMRPLNLSSLDNLVYHCKINDCINHFKNINKNEWIKCKAVTHHNLSQQSLN